MYSTFDMDPINVDTNGICENQTTGGAASLTLDGTLCDLGTAGVFDIYDAGYSSGIGGVKIAIDSAGDVSGITFTVTGTDENGAAVTEAITGVTTTAVQSTTYWQTITSIAADGEVDSNVFIGPVDEIITKTIPMNRRADNAGTVAISGLSGTCQFDVDVTYSKIQDGVTPVWYVDQSNKSADMSASLPANAYGCRLKFDSYSSGAELQFTVVQN